MLQLGSCTLCSITGPLWSTVPNISSCYASSTSILWFIMLGHPYLHNISSGMPNMSVVFGQDCKELGIASVGRPFKFKCTFCFQLISFTADAFSFFRPDNDATTATEDAILKESIHGQILPTLFPLRRYILCSHFTFLVLLCPHLLITLNVVQGKCHLPTLVHSNPDR